MYESKLAEVRCQVEQDLVRKVRTDVERELRTSLEQNLRLQPSRRDSDPQAQLRKATGPDSPADRGHLPAAQAEQLASLISKAISAIERHLEALHLQEHERLRKNCEEQLQRLKQKHMMERLECELQHNEELERFRKQQQEHHHHHHHQHQSCPASQHQPSEPQPQQLQSNAVGPSKIDTLLRDLYVENARLLRALQRAEDGRRRAEHNSTRLQYKCRVLSKLLTDVTRAAVDGGSSRVACA
ncbi:hypothetical protein MRX96_011326 [Rhipicephalus microplus]